MSNEQVTYVKHPLVKPNMVEHRLYQERIAETAINYDTLVILPTALGKTIISVLVVAEMLYKYRRGRVLFMAPTKPLVLQHMNTFLNMMKFRRRDIVMLTGENPPRDRESLWRNGARVVFATPQIVRNDLMKERVNLKEFILVIFDECHRAVGNYAYAKIGQIYAEQSDYPLITGMTASPGSDLKKIMEICRNLYIERVEYRIEEDSDVKPYIQPIKMQRRTVKLPSLYMAAKAQLWSLLEKRLNWLKARGYLRRGSKFVGRKELLVLGDTLRYRLETSPANRRGPIYPAIISQSLCLTLYHMLILLETQGLYTFKEFMEQVEEEKESKRSYSIMVKQPEYQALKELLNNNWLEHPKAELLISIVEEQMSTQPSSRMLVFTQYRDTASHLVELLNKNEGVRAARFVGQGRRYGNLGLSQGEQTERIEQLRKGDLNVLVATSIGEEGLDIPSVEHVVFYEPIPSGIRYIQRRGRTGRRSSGKVTILATEDTLDMINLYSSSRRTEKMRTIISSVNSRLPKVIRSSPRPPIDQMINEDLKALEKEDITESVETQVNEDFYIDLAEVQENKSRKNLDTVTQNLYLKLLEKGSKGATLDQLIQENKHIEKSEPILKTAIKRLQREKIVTLTKTGKYVCSSTLRNYGKTHFVRVNKVKRGYVEVLVDNKYKAKIFWEEYDGPRSLWKKGSSFNAVSDLYMSSGEMHLWIKEITEVFEHD